MKRWPQLDGMRFEEVLLSFPDAIPCGVKVAARKGQIVLNPEDEYVLRDGDELLVIAEDDDTYFPCPVPKVQYFSTRRKVVLDLDGHWFHMGQGQLECSRHVSNLRSAVFPVCTLGVFLIGIVDDVVVTPFNSVL